MAMFDHYLYKVGTCVSAYSSPSIVSKPVDNFDLSLNISEPDTCGSPTGYMAVDQTFHTPSFGDEEFDIPPLSLQPNTLQNNRINVMYTQTLSHHQHSQNQTMQQVSPSCNQTLVMSNMPVERMMESPPQYHGPPEDVYLQQIGEVMPQQSINIQVQHGYEAQYRNHRMHIEQMQQHSMMRQQTHLRNMGHHPQHPPTSVMNCHSPLLTTISQSQLSNQLGMHVRMSQQGPGSVGSSPTGSTHTSPCHETSEDSDDSTPLSQQLLGSMKRPSPEPVETCLKMMNNTNKKPKVQKKKKKRDPNEPQKPVSAYALFFRDTQAAIKGQNPNASFGEVSKIVASMWDSLDVEHKNVYKKKTEAAKKEYLKALAAYRASLVSKAAADQSDSLYGNSVSSTTISTTVSSSSPGHQHSLSPLQKKSPLLTSLMEGTAPPPGTTLQSMTQPQQPMLNSQVWGMHPMNTTTTVVHQQGQMGQIIHTQAGHQMNHQMVQMSNGQPMTQLPQCQPPEQQPQPVQNVNQPVSNSPPYTQNMSISMQQQMGLGNNQGGLATQGLVNQGMQQTCLRNGCSNPAVDSPDWDREYCSSECVVSHCRDVFSAWVASRQTNNSFASVK